jgi:hypothetical protein
MTSTKTMLKVAFATAALSLAPLALAQPPARSEGRVLTAGENEMIAIFGKEVNPAILKLHAGPRKGTTAGEAFDPRTIAVYGHPFLSLDYSKEKDPFNFGLFYHEFTHTWQFQTGWTYTKGHCPGGYRYRLKENSTFEDFCSESQAAIVEDYARRYHMPQSAPSNWYASTCGKDTKEHDAMLLKVVETRFPNAKVMREKIGRGEVLPDAIDRPKDAPACPRQEQDDTPETQKGQPVYFCETLAYAFSNIKGLAFKQGLPAWPGFEAKLDKKAPLCTVAVWGSPILHVSGADFGPNGQMKQESLVTLAGEIVKYTPQGIVVPVQDNLSQLFGNLVDKQKTEIAVLRAIESKDTARRILQNLENQLKDDPSLPPNSRSFVEEKIRVVKEVLQKMGQPPAPDGAQPKKPDPVVKRGNGTGGGNNGGVMPDGGQPRPPQPKPVEKRPEPAKMSPDNNIKDVLDSAFGRKTPAKLQGPAA